MDISIEQVYKYGGMLLGLVTLAGLFWMYNKYTLVKQSVGWNFINSMGGVKRGFKGLDIVLEIVSQSGKRRYIPSTQTPIINYNTLEKGEEVKKGVIYDERAVERINGIPILKCTPIDIRPIDRETGLLVNIPSELIDKLAVDASKSAENEAKKDKQMKILIYGLVGMAVLFIVALSYINQTNAELQIKLAEATIDAAKSATVIAG